MGEGGPGHHALRRLRVCALAADDASFLGLAQFDRPTTTRNPARPINEMQRNNNTAHHYLLHLGAVASRPHTIYPRHVYLRAACLLSQGKHLFLGTATPPIQIFLAPSYKHQLTRVRPTKTALPNLQPCTLRRCANLLPPTSSTVRLRTLHSYAAIRTTRSFLLASL